MLPSKPRSGLSDTSNNKTVPAAPKPGKIGRAGSTKSDSGTPPPIQKSRSSPRMVESKPAVERRAPKPNSTTPDKQSRAPKGSELQVQEDLKKAKEQLASAGQEKARVVEELKDAKRLADEANEKLKEALAAQKRSEKILEIEKFRADELEQASLESSKKKQEEWEKELDGIKKKHSLEVEALLSRTQELEKVKDELEVTTKAKISALSEAEDAMKIAETNTEKVELLSGEISRLKSLLDTKLDSSNGDTAEMIKKLDSEIDLLRYELERAKQTEEKVVIMESLVERLSTEADNAKSTELDSLKLVDEWKKKAELLEIQLTEARQSEKSSLETPTSVKKQLECNALLQDSELEISALRQKIELLEDRLEEANQAEKSSSESLVALEKQLEEVNSSLQDAESEAAVLRGKVESLEIEVADVKKAARDSAKLSDELKMKTESLEVQLAEANQFTESSSDSLASVTKQLEDSNSFLQDVLSENATLRVKIESLEVDLAQCKEDLKDSERHLDAAQQEAIEMGKADEGLKSEIQTLEQALSTEKAAASDADSFSEERNKLLKELEIARQEEGKAKKAMEDLASALHEMSAEARETQERLFAKRVEHEDAHAQIEQLRSALRNTEENYEVMLDEARYEIVCLKKAIEKLETEAKESHAKWNSQDHNLGMIENGGEIAMVNGEEIVANCTDEEALEEAEAETLRLKERLLDRENELHSIRQENAELRIQEATSIKKVNELSTLVAEAITKESGELSNSEKDYNLLPSSKTWGRCFGSKSSGGYESAIVELNKEMESIFGEPPSASGLDSTAGVEPQSLSFGSFEGQQTLSHVNSSGQAAMVDVSSKDDSKRVAVASCRVLLGQKAFSLVAANQIAKGDVLNVAKIAGISGAKQTSSLIPLCHNIGLTHIRVDLTLNEKESSVEIEGEAATAGKTGVEMEAMTAVAVAGLTVYDMCKAASKDIQISDIRLEHKTGGKSGTWSRSR